MITLAPTSVVVVNHNANGALEQCLRSILDQAVQVILVDNDSSPAPFEDVVRLFAGHPRLTILRNRQNVGFAVACNQGAAVATESTLLFLNPDCIAPPGLLGSLLAVLGSDPKVGMVGGLLVNPDGSEQGGARRSIPTVWSAFVRASGLWRACRLFGQMQHDFHLEACVLPGQPAVMEAVSGACMLLRREAFQAVQGFDPGYFLHCEDLDLCLRVRQAGWTILFSPTPGVPHLKGVCGRDKLLLVEWHKHRGMMRFYRKHLGAKEPWYLTPLVGCGIWLRFVGVCILSLPKMFLDCFSRAPEALPPEALRNAAGNPERVSRT